MVRFDLTLLRDGLSSPSIAPSARGARLEARAFALDVARAPGHFNLSPPVPVPGRAPSRPPGGEVGPAPRAKVASYPTLERAREAVDMLSKEGLSTRHVCVVGEAEGPSASLTYGRAAAHGAAAGAWVGLALGFLSGVVKIGSWHAQALGEPAAATPFLALALLCAVAGALVGASLGALTHAISFAASESKAAAAAPPRYDVLVDADHAEGARALLLLVGP